MSEALETIKALGIDQVHAKTHISGKNLEAIFTGSFEGMQPVQFAGFVSILEREYGVDLNDLREEYTRYREEHPDEDQHRTTIVPPSFEIPKKGHGWVYGVLAFVVIVIIYRMLTMSNGGETLPAQKPAQKPEPKPAVSLQAEAPAAVPETVLPASAAEEEVAVEEAQIAEADAVEEGDVISPETAAAETLRIIPNVKVWVGMIDLESYERKQALTSDPIPVDTSRSWLILLGHGNVNIEHGRELIEVNNRDRVRYLYESGELRQITKAEFEQRNRGRGW